MQQQFEVAFEDVRVPALGYGTWRLTGEDAYRGVRTALEVGYRHVDTASMYGNEEEVGRALADSDVDRDEVFVTTKVSHRDAASPHVRRSAEASLARLGLDHVDLLLLHWPAEPAVPLEETLEAMVAVREAGLTRAIGVSNFPSSMLARACALAPIATDQVEHHPYLAIRRITETMHAHGGFVTAYAPLAEGRVAHDPTLRAIGERHGALATQVALRWQLQRGHAAIPKSGDPRRIAANLDVFGFELSDEELHAIDALDRGERLVDPPHAPDWDDA